jgi:putative Mg2+ transporter-C (MgtC) family protein
MPHAEYELAVRIAVGLVVAYAFGFERQLRGSPAGDRTFALIGLGATAVTAVTGRSSPQAVAGVITGIGFIGGGIVFHSEGGLVRGITTAATIFTTAGIGIVIGYGHLLLGVLTAAAVLLILELEYIPGLRLLDAHHYSDRVASDRDGQSHPPEEQGPAR